jgi:DNA-binding MarR family transcriptional regulator
MMRHLPANKMMLHLAGRLGKVTHTPWLQADEERAWRGFVQMHNRLAAALHRQLQRDSGLSLGDYEVLVHLTDVPEGRLRPYELQARLEWEQSRLSHHLRRMQQRGLVTRQDCGEDRRGSYVAITPQGRRAIEAAAPGHVGAVRRLFVDQLSTDQLTLLERLSAQVLAGLDSDS